HLRAGLRAPLPVRAGRETGRAGGRRFRGVPRSGLRGFNAADGERLFNEDGSDTELLKNAVGFLGEFQQNIDRTRTFMQYLVKHDLLEARNVQLHKGEPDSGHGITLNGLFMVNEEKLRALDEKVAHEMLREGVMAWIYAH